MQTSTGLPARTPTPFANSGAKNTIPLASQTAVTPGAASYTDGFPPLTRTAIAAGGVPPFGLDFNGIFNAITAAIRWSNAGGQYSYDSTFSTAVGGYPKGAILARTGYDGFWISTAENNTTNPDTGGAGWIALNGQGGDYGIDTGSANIYTVAFSPAVLVLKDGMTLKFKALTANTGASTFSPNGLATAPIVGSAHAALQGGEIVPTGDVWLQWNSSIGSGSWVLVDSTGGGLQVTAASKSRHAVQLVQMTGLVGAMRNASMSIPAASATATFTADEISVKSALGGVPWLLTNYSQAINLAATGAGGMDTGAAPLSGFVALYAIFNSSTGAASILATNATAAAQPAIYGGANMPAGYTASALISVLPTTAAGIFALCMQTDNKIDIAEAIALSSSVSQVSPTLFTTTVFPKNARLVSGSTTVSSTSASGMTLTVYASDVSVGRQINNGTVTAAGQQTVPFNRLSIKSSQTMRYLCSSSAGTPTFIIAVSSYEF